MYPEIFPALLDASLSGKLKVLVALLKAVRGHGDWRESIAKAAKRDRVVVVSHYTAVLDLVECLCKEERWSFGRLDGSVTVKHRQNRVREFNASTSKQFVFLLSAKAGGAGLNLIGANRLVLLDPAWYVAVCVTVWWTVGEGGGGTGG